MPAILFIAGKFEIISTGANKILPFATRYFYPRLAGAVLLAAMAAPVSAVVECAGIVDNLSLQMDTSGTVTLSLSGGPTYVYLCTVDGAGMNAVSPVVCRTMYNTLALAKITGKRVLIRFHNYNSCAAIQSWAPAGVLICTQLLLD